MLIILNEFLIPWCLLFLGGKMLLGTVLAELNIYHVWWKNYQKCANFGSITSYNHCFGRSEHTMWNVPSGLLNWTTLCHFTSILLIINKQLISMVDIWVSQWTPLFIIYGHFSNIIVLGGQMLSFVVLGSQNTIVYRNGGSPMTTLYLKRSKILIFIIFQFFMRLVLRPLKYIFLS